MIAAGPGDLVAWWSDAGLDIGVVLGDEKRRLRVVGTDGRESRFPAGRVAIAIDRSGDGDPVQRATDAERRVDALANDVEVEAVWELALEAGDRVGVSELAELGTGESGAVACVAVIRAFLRDGIHFVRKGDAWLPRAADAVEKLRAERALAGRREVERDRATRALASAVAGRAPDPMPSGALFERWISALERLAVFDLDVSDEDRRVAEEALRLAGARGATPAEAAFRVLRVLGRIDSDDANLQIDRYGLRVDFPAEVTDRAWRIATAGFARDNRADLTGLDAFTVDSRSTREIDDALSWEPLGAGRARLGIHVADPASMVRPGDVVDDEARARGVTHYFPELRIPMLPPELGENACSLTEGEDRPAISFLAEVDPEGNVEATDVVRSIVRVRRRLTYREADAGTGADWRAVLATARRLQAERAAAGAVRIDTPEIDVRVEAGRVELERSDGGSDARTVVSEAMILAGSIAADFCDTNGIEAIYRRQLPPTDPSATPAGVITDPVAARATRRRLRRGETVVAPGPHHALGLDRYLQATSPLRRFQDLANHRQIAAFLRGETPPYDRDAIRRIASTTERAELDARRAERAARRYWLLRYLEAEERSPLCGVVVESGPRPVVWLVETGLEVTVPALSGTPEGEAVALRVVEVRPRADVLRLRPLEGRD